MKTYTALCLLLSSFTWAHADELMDKIRKDRMDREEAARKERVANFKESILIVQPHVFPTPISGTWYYNGSAHKGKLIKTSPDRQKVYSISDWNNYQGSWLDVAGLDLGTRVEIDVATPEEKAKYAKLKEERDAQAKRDREMDLITAEQEERQRKLQEQAQTEAQKLAIQREILELLRRQEILMRNQSGPIYIYVPDY